MIQDLSESWCIKGTGESTLVMDSPVLLMHHDPDRSSITDPDPDHPKGTQAKGARVIDFCIQLASLSVRLEDKQVQRSLF